VLIVPHVGWIESARDVPPETVALVEEPSDQLRRLVDAVVFDIEDGMRAGDDPFGALEDAELMAFDVDLDERDGEFRDKSVERETRDGC